MKRYLILAGYIMIGFSLLAACSRAPISTADIIESEATIDESEPAGDASAETSVDMSLDSSSDASEADTEIVSEEPDTGLQYRMWFIVDGGEKISPSTETVRVDPDSAHTVELMVEIPETINESLTYQWIYTDINRSEICNIISADRMITINDPENSGIGIFVEADGWLNCIITDPEGRQQTSQLTVLMENHLFAWPGDYSRDQAIEDGSNNIVRDVEYIWPAIPDEPLTLSVNVEADDMAGVTYSWESRQWVDFSGDNDAHTSFDIYEPSLTIDAWDEFDWFTQGIECYVTDKYGNGYCVVFHPQKEPFILLCGVTQDGNANRYNKNITYTVESGSEQELRVKAFSNDMDSMEFEWQQWDPSRSEFTVIPEKTENVLMTGQITEDCSYRCVVRDQTGNSDQVDFNIEIAVHP